ncbi:hypothetical protein SDC9_171994 [bioreactor metagenome]|uniref:Uncharacterized protein n=1 Tax=bioreactor metagenome TaxID=1076179 RepID=A0A645GLI9_9ZZZZ
MAIVPEPQRGSASTLEGSHLLKSTNAAAKVSFKGASPASSLYPLLCNPGPDVSIVNVTISLSIATSILYSAPLSGNVSILYFLFIDSTTAFFTMD